MAVALNRFGTPILAALLVLMIGGALLLGLRSYDRDYVVSVEDDGSAVTKIIADRFAGASSLKVSEMSGTIQSSRESTRPVIRASVP